MVDNGDNLSLTEQTVASINEMILLSGVRPGDRFGNEADLERKLGVSRVVVREAVSRLRALGMLESRQGLGLIVGKPDPFGLLEQTLARHTLDSADLLALEELRYVLEVGAVELAVKRAAAAQVERLAALAEELAECCTGSPSARTVDDVEMDFHRTILEATHSAMLERMHPVLAVVFSRKEREVPNYSVTTTTERDGLGTSDDCPGVSRTERRACPSRVERAFGQEPYRCWNHVYREGVEMAMEVKNAVVGDPSGRGTSAEFKVSMPARMQPYSQEEIDAVVEVMTKSECQTQGTCLRKFEEDFRSLLRGETRLRRGQLHECPAAGRHPLPPEAGRRSDRSRVHVLCHRHLVRNVGREDRVGRHRSGHVGNRPEGRRAGRSLPAPRRSWRSICWACRPTCRRSWRSPPSTACAWWRTAPGAGRVDRRAQGGHVRRFWLLQLPRGQEHDHARRRRHTRPCGTTTTPNSCRACDSSVAAPMRARAIATGRPP